jgi:hypothetical protein
VGGEPDVRVEHGLKHLHRVAAAGQVMRDEQRGERDDGCREHADAIAVDPLDAGAEDDDRPADKDGGRIEIRHGRATLDVDARREAECVKEERERHHPERGALKRRPRAGEQPRRADEQEDGDVKRHAVDERFEVVEEHFELRAARDAGKV